MSNNDGDVFNEIKRLMDSNTHGAIKGVIDGTGLTLGSITETGLKLDNFKHEFTDYMALDYLKMEDNHTTESAGNQSHSHEIRTPSNLTKLNVGDKVLVAQFGADNVVIGRVVSNG
ncbi:hypothetical protein [Clostridium beijerinckii]|uniref:hypothetical protein n=1 Tax=Clostridium beijerinckii TaxID=1520 RepID=UPI002432C9D0|nr:hypothetical protein [Clostridium beijerinckii]MDG5852504.1 hypothetical protein [Clostridium beijerinckii]